jgi:hypothetical protein
MTIIIRECALSSMIRVVTSTIIAGNDTGRVDETIDTAVRLLSAELALVHMTTSAPPKSTAASHAEIIRAIIIIAEKVLGRLY